jgi:hypothetical protein
MYKLYDVLWHPVENIQSLEGKEIFHCTDIFPNEERSNASRVRVISLICTSPMTSSGNWYKRSSVAGKEIFHSTVLLPIERSDASREIMICTCPVTSYAIGRKHPE